MKLTLPKDDYRNQPKVCTTCNKLKDPSKFKLEKDSRATNGITQRSKCTECDEFRKYKRFIQKTYQFSWQDYEEMFDSQGGKCAICESKVSSSRTSRLFVDHCHDTLKIRGLLCSNCNHGLGHFKDSPKLLQRAINYLTDKE
jgi:hypothetical protein